MMNLKSILSTALAVTLPLVGAQAQPIITNCTASVYAVVPDPYALSFGADGALYVGRDNGGTGNPNEEPFKIRRVGPGGSPVAEFGNAAIPDPDAVIVDRTGAVSGIADAVLVGGMTGPNTGQISRVAPDGTVTALFGPSSLYINPNGFAFDALGRLLFTEWAQGRVYRTDGGTPTLLLTLSGAFSIATDAAERIVVSPANNPGRLVLYSASGTLSNANFAALRPATPLARGPGGMWTTDLYGITESGKLIRVALDGATRTIGSGFGDIVGLTFGPDGALYASDFAGDCIWRLQPLPSGLISWWRGEDSTSDETGAHPGSVVGNLAYAPGQVGQAFSLNGSNTAVALGSWFNLQEFTISFWVNPAANQVQWANILDNNHTDHRSWVFQSGNNSSGEASQWSWGAAGMGAYGNFYWLTNNTWQHVVATMSSNHISQLYLNGKRMFTITGTRPITYDGTQSLELGRHHLLGRYFKGLMDELMVFNRPLSEEEVTSLYVNQGGALTLNIQPQDGGVLLARAKAQTCTTPPPGLVAWWSGDGYPLDLAGANNGTPQGGVNYQPAKVGAGFSFDSNDDRVVVPYDQSLDISPGGFTCAFWMCGGKSQPEGLATLVEKSHGYIDSTGWVFTGFTADGRVHFAVGRGGALPADKFTEVISIGDLLDNQFHHVVGTWDGAAMALYVDGQFQGTTPLTTPVNNGRPLNLGFSWGAGTPQRFFRGALDEVTIFNRALTSNEITVLYAADSAGMCKPPHWTVNTLPSGLIAWWQAEGNYLDSADAHHGSSGATFGPGRFGEAFHFNGVNQSVAIPDATGDLNDWTQFTLEAWVKLDQSADVVDGAPGRTIINRIGNANDQANFNQGYQFGFVNNATALYLAFNIDGQAWPGIITKATYPEPLPTNVWLHVAATYDHNAVKLYLNGVPQVTNVIGAATVRHSTSSFRIGMDDNRNGPFAGSIDDVRVYNRALTTTEIGRLALSLPGANGVWGLKTHDPLSQPPTTMFYFDENGANYREVARVTLAGVEIEADGLAMSPAGRLFAFQINATGGSRLLALDPTTAVASAVGPVLSGRNIRGATFTLSGRLLAFDYELRELVEVSPVTGLQVGAAVPLDMNINATSTAGDFAQMPDGSLLFAYHEFVYRLDPRSGSLVKIHEDQVPLLDGCIPYCCGIVCALGSEPADKLFCYEATQNDDVYQYLPSSGFDRLQLYNNIVPSYNAGRGDLAALPAACVELLNFSVTGNNATIATICRGGCWAEVHFTDDLNAPNWQIIPDTARWVPYTSGTIATAMIWTNLPVDPPHRFFRVQISN